MSKRIDLQFHDADAFIKAHPHLAINKPVPNYAAIRAILRAGQKLEGVELVEVVKEKTLREVITSEKHKA